MLSIDDLIQLLENLHEYMDNKSDVVDGDYGTPSPNKELVFAGEIEEAIDKLKKVEHVISRM